MRVISISAYPTPALLASLQFGTYRIPTWRGVHACQAMEAAMIMMVYATERQRRNGPYARDPNEQKDSFQEVPRDQDEALASPAAIYEGCRMVS